MHPQVYSLGPAGGPGGQPGMALRHQRDICSADGSLVHQPTLGGEDSFPSRFQ